MFTQIASHLRGQGYCIYAVNYGREPLSPYGTADLMESSQEVAAFIDSVLEETGAEKVDLVAHSQGALHAKNYVSRFGNADEVGRVVTLGGNLHGITLNGTAVFSLLWSTLLPTFTSLVTSPAAIQQVAGSPTMVEANSYPDTAAGVTYTSLVSSLDTVVTPNSASYFEAVPGANVVNLDAQAACSPAIPITHPYDAPNDDRADPMGARAPVGRSGARPGGLQGVGTSL